MCITETNLKKGNDMEETNKINRIIDLLKPVIKGDIIVGYCLGFGFEFLISYNNIICEIYIDRDRLMNHYPKTIAVEIEYKYKEYIVKEFINTENWISLISL